MDHFIEQVKCFPCLWDMGDPAYKDFEVMERAWAEVAQATSYPDAKAAKSQWKKLRDNFREALKRQRESKSNRPWRYYRQMEFLIPYMQSKNGDLICEGEKATSDSGDIGSYTDDKQYITLLEDDGNDSCSSLPRKKRRNCPIMPYVEDPKVEDINRTVLTSGRNPLLDFFNSMYNTTEELPPDLQLQVKRKVFDIVTQAEETALMLQDYEKQNKEYDVQDFL